MPDVPARRGAMITAAVCLGFAALALLGQTSHEMWRDELEIWLIARDSATLPALLTHMGTEGHPALWYVLNFLLARVTRAPSAMQWLNLAIGTVTVAVFWRHAPFSALQRALFVTGYYALYEFTVISRSYGLALLLTFAFCTIYGRRRRLDALSGLVLVLLANTVLYGTVVAALLVLWCLLTSRRKRAPLPWVGAGLAAFGILVGFGHTLQQSLAIGPDHASAHAPTYDLDWVVRGLATVTYGFLPLPDPTTPFTWNSHLSAMLPGAAGPVLSGLLGLALLGGCVLALQRRPALLLVFLLGVAAMLGIVYFVWYGSTRHHGQVFLWFLTCCWLSTVDGRVGASTAPAERWAKRMISGALAVQLVAGIGAYAVDIARPFSNARAAAAQLRRLDPASTCALAGSVDYAAEPISAYLDRPIYYPESRRFGTFLDWSERRRLVGFPQVVEQTVDLLAGGERCVLLVLNYPLELPGPGEARSLQPGVRITHVGRLRGAIVRDENYDLYRLDPEPR